MYLAFKTIHLFCVVLFLGNIISGVLWKLRADRTRDPRIIRHVIEGVISSDRLFTIPGVIGITVFGMGAAGMGDLPMLRTGWVFWSLMLFILSGVAFMVQLVPLQRKLAAVAREGAEGAAMDWAAYEALSRRWKFWGAVALLAPVLVMILMVLKPVLPGI